MQTPVHPQILRQLPPDPKAVQRHCLRASGRGEDPIDSFRFRAYYSTIKTKISPFGLAMSVTGALLVGLSPNVRAIPVPVSINLHAAALANLGNGRQIFTGSTRGLLLSPSVPVLSANLNFERGFYLGDGRHVLTPPIRTVSYVPAPTHSPGFGSTRIHPPGRNPPQGHSVPDGGSTGLMLGGVFGGLVLLGKRFS